MNPLELSIIASPDPPPMLRRPACRVAIASRIDLENASPRMEGSTKISLACRSPLTSS